MSLTNLDRRRANPPVTTAPIYLADASDDEEESTPNIQRETARPDRHQSRPIFVQTGLVSQASGSAYYESDSVKVACAVYGPKQLKSKVYSDEAEVNVDVRFASFANKRRKRAGKVGGCGSGRQELLAIVSQGLI